MQNLVNAEPAGQHSRSHLVLQHSARKKVAPCDQQELKQTSNAVV